MNRVAQWLWHLLRMVATRPRLYAWRPNGHGEVSWYVVAYSEAEAVASIAREIHRRAALPFEQIGRLHEYDVRGWGTDYYALTVAEVGQPLDNANN